MPAGTVVATAEGKLQRTWGGPMGVGDLRWPSLSVSNRRNEPGGSQWNAAAGDGECDEASRRRRCKRWSGLRTRQCRAGRRVGLDGVGGGQGGRRGKRERRATGSTNVEEDGSVSEAKSKSQPSLAAATSLTRQALADHQ
jgi:hypothetical protein